MSGRVETPGETSARRRRVVTLLDDVETPATVDQLVDRLDGDVATRSRPGGSPSWETLHERLTDEDLPALDRAGLLTFDEERGIVMRRGPDGGSDATPSESANVDVRSGDHAVDQRRDAPYFLGLAVVSLGLVALTTFDVGPFAWFSDQLVSTTLVVVFSLLAIANVMGR